MESTGPSDRALALVPMALAIVTFEAVVAIVGGLAFLVYELARPEGMADPVLSILRTLGVVGLGLGLLRTTTILSERRLTRASDRFVLTGAAVANLVFFAPLVWFSVTDPVAAQSNVLILAIAGLGLATAWVLSSAARGATEPPA